MKNINEKIIVKHGAKNSAKIIAVIEYFFRSISYKLYAKIFEIKTNPNINFNNNEKLVISNINFFSNIIFVNKLKI